jgi:triacylglycerol lipase
LIERVADVSEDLDIAYGDDPRQKLDVYWKDDGRTGKTMVIYIPGGGFTGGDKRQDGTFFGNVGRFFASRDMVGVAANYRLAPAFKWPAAAQDIKAAVRWMKTNAGRYGAAAHRVVIFGHSAGAAHVASYVFDPELRGGEDVIGAVLASGLYALRRSEMRANVVQYFGDDEESYERRSALSHVAMSKVPVLLSVAEFDPVYLAAPGFELGLALTRRDGAPPPFLRLDDHNHFSCICSFGTADDRLSAPVLRFIESLPR